MSKMYCLVVLLLAGHTASLHAEPDHSALSSKLRTVTQLLLDAVAQGERSTWDEHLHPDFQRMDDDDAILARKDFLQALKALPPGLEGSLTIGRFEVIVDGPVAITLYTIQETLNYHGQALRSRFRSVDSWVNTAVGWQLFAQHVAAELKDPPSIELPYSILCGYQGRYHLTDDIETHIECTTDRLHSSRDGRPRSGRIFLRNAQGAVEAFVDRREGEDVLWRKVDPSGDINE